MVKLMPTGSRGSNTVCKKLRYFTVTDNELFDHAIINVFFNSLTF